MGASFICGKLILCRVRCSSFTGLIIGLFGPVLRGPLANVNAKGCRSLSARQKSLSSTLPFGGRQGEGEEARYPFVISTMKKIVPNEARAVSAVMFLQKLNGRSSDAINEHSSAVLPA